MMDQENFKTQVEGALQQCRHNVQEFVTGASLGFREELIKYDALFAPLALLAGQVSLYVRAHPAAGMRELCMGLEQELAELQTDVSLDPALYQRLLKLELGPQASAEELRLHEHALRDFRRSGVDKDAATRARIRELQQELVIQGQQFEVNIIQASCEFVIESGRAGLAGLPADFIAAHPEREDGSVAISTDLADRMPFMTYAEDGELRRRYLELCSNLARQSNPAVLRRILELRHELAQLLGFAHWADYVTEDKMVKSASAASAFLERVIEVAAPRSAQDCAALLAEKRRSEAQASQVYEWETAYLAELVKRRTLHFDSQEVRPYLAYGRVKQGLLELVSELYGVVFQPVQQAEVWHPSVECLEVLEAGVPIARLYLDMHPRPEKFKHAAMFPLSAGPSGELPAGVLMCNFPEPKGAHPALLQHFQVSTFFHEFGHLMHQLFAGRQPSFAFSGIACEFDFVEVPSQMFEEWASDARILARFALHHETEQPIPAELVGRMRAADSFGRGLGSMRQLVFASLSMAYYDRHPSQVDLAAMLQEIKARLLPISQQPDAHSYASFGHLNGYSAIYYTYLWSLVISKDFFSRFEPDLLSTQVASEFRFKVLEPGGARDAEQLVRDFLGRDYAFDAFERYLNA